MGVRDRLVVAVLAVGLLLGMAAWQVSTPWLGIAIAMSAVVCACAIYRVDPHARDSAAVRRHDLVDDGAGDVSTRRRAAGRP